jgi:hypothetical protein
MPYYESDGKGGLVPAKDVPEEAIWAIEKYDDEAIVSMMSSGAASQDFVYSFTIAGKDVYGISTTGADQLANLIGNLEVLNDARIDKDSDQDFIYATLRVKNLERNVTLLGVGRQCKFIQGKNNVPDRSRNDEHAFVKAISKAQRNGILHHSNENLVRQIVQRWITENKNTRRLNPPPVSTGLRPAPVPTPTPRAPAPGQNQQPPRETEGERRAAFAADQAAMIKAQQEKLAGMRVAVLNRFHNELHVVDDVIRSLLKEKFGEEELSKLSESQLNECDQFVDETIAAQAGPPEQPEPGPVPQNPATPVPAPSDAPKSVRLGFASDEDQTKLRDVAYQLIVKQLGMNRDQAVEFVKSKGYASTAEMPRDALTQLIAEVQEMVKAKNQPEAGEF